MKMTSTAGALVALALAAAGPAGATITVTTYKGDVLSGYDGNDLFHVADRNLAGQKFSVTYWADDSVVPPSGSNYVVPTQSDLEGGSVVFTPSPISAVFTINGYDIPVPGLFYGFARGLNIPDYVSSLGYTAGDHNYDNGEHGLHVTARIFSPTYSHSDIPADYHTPFSWTQGPGSPGYLGDGDFASYGTDPVDHVYKSTTAELRPTSVTVSGAPEPSAWALLFLGIAGVGATLRRRRLSAAVPA